jgi:hypothetical protein
MTPAQHGLYIRRWITVVRANHWVMRKGRLVDNAIGAKASEWHGAVWTAATQKARQEYCGVTAHHLRHACHWVAFGRWKSSKDLSNPEFNRLLVLFGNERPMNGGGMKGLLVDPLDLASIQAWENPEESERASFVAWLRQTGHEAALIAISSNAFGTRLWSELPMESLRYLAKQVRRRPGGNAERGVRSAEQKRGTFNIQR